jgi:hypothetical protein
VLPIVIAAAAINLIFVLSYSLDDVLTLYYKDDFDNPKEYDVARDFIEDFFAIMKNDTKFSNEILKKARTK